MYRYSYKNVSYAVLLKKWSRRVTRSARPYLTKTSTRVTDWNGYSNHFYRSESEPRVA